MFYIFKGYLILCLDRVLVMFEMVSVDFGWMIIKVKRGLNVIINVLEFGLVNRYCVYCLYCFLYKI